MKATAKNCPNRARIGVFDSGVGGLTVLLELQRRFPYAHLIYFGDTAHVPYGSKSEEAIIAYSLANAQFLQECKVDFLVVACNTSSAIAGEIIKEKVALPIVEVVAAGVQSAVQVLQRRRRVESSAKENANSHRKINKIKNLNGKSSKSGKSESLNDKNKNFNGQSYRGEEGNAKNLTLQAARKPKIVVIGTYRTIHSHVYATGLQKRIPEALVLEKACPLFVPLVEENFQNEYILREVVKEYLGGIIEGSDALLLGCTHYPLLKPAIRNAYAKENFAMIDSAIATAEALEHHVKNFAPIAYSQNGANLQKTRKKTATGKVEIYSSDVNESFLAIAKRLFPSVKVKLKRAELE